METLVEQRVQILKVIGETAASGDVKKMDAAFAERKKLDKQIADFAANAEKSARDAAIPQMVESLKSIDMKANGILMSGVVLSGTLRRSDNGIFDDLKIGVGFAGEAELSAILYSAIKMEAVKDLESVKGINFSIGRDKIEITYTGRAPSGSGGGSNGTGGKGWYKGGTKYSLADVFEAFASDEDREKLTAAGDDGNKLYSIKLAVAKKQDEFVLGT